MFFCNSIEIVLRLFDFSFENKLYLCIRNKQKLTVMKSNYPIIAKAFLEHYDALCHYVDKRINDIEIASDIVQDVFLRLLKYEEITEQTVKSLCYTIAGNLIIDHVRRNYKRCEVYSQLFVESDAPYVLTPEQITTFHDLAEKEQCLMTRLTPRTAQVYKMTRMDELSIDEIARQLSLSRRTVACHQFNGRKIIREEIRKVI